MDRRDAVRAVGPDDRQVGHSHRLQRPFLDQARADRTPLVAGEPGAQVIEQATLKRAARLAISYPPSATMSTAVTRRPRAIVLNSDDPTEVEIAEALGCTGDLVTLGQIGDWEVLSASVSGGDILVIGRPPIIGGASKRLSCTLDDQTVKSVAVAVRHVWGWSSGFHPSLEVKVMTLNIHKTPRPGTKRGAAVKAARDNLGRTPQEICRIIAATPEFGGDYDEARKYYIWARDPWDPNTRVNGPYIDPALYPAHP